MTRPDFFTDRWVLCGSIIKTQYGAYLVHAEVGTVSHPDTSTMATRGLADAKRWLRETVGVTPRYDRRSDNLWFAYVASHHYDDPRPEELA